MQIRAAMAFDLVAVASCSDLSFGPPRNPDNRVDLALQIQEGSIHVICNARQMLGYISFSPNTDHLFVNALAVLPKLRRQGLGTQLMAFAEKEALRLDLHSVRLFTNGKIVGNLIFYLRHGYRETERCEEGSFSRVFYSKDIASRRRNCPTANPSPLDDR